MTLLTQICSVVLMLAPLAVVAGGKPTIVLLHGAFQDGNSTWRKVKPELEEHGYKVIVVNLPGRGGDGADPKSLTTEIYRDTVLKAISGETEPVILVGHSFGGITISNVAEAAPEKIKALVYLSAYLPQDGQSLMTLAQTDRDSYLGKPGNLSMETIKVIYNCLPPDEWKGKSPNRSSFSGAFSPELQKKVLNNWSAYGFQQRNPSL